MITHTGKRIWPFARRSSDRTRGMDERVNAAMRSLHVAFVHRRYGQHSITICIAEQVIKAAPPIEAAGGDECVFSSSRLWRG